MDRSPTDSPNKDFQAKRSPQPAAMMISGITHRNDSPAPSVRATEEVPGMRHVQGNPEDHSEVGPAPKPCERCVRTEKTCRGVANARCEHCKRLKQRCSNSTGPARGKHAAAARLLATSGATSSKGSFPHALAPGPNPRVPQQGLKRKLEDRQDGPSHRHPAGNSSPREEEESDDGHGVPARLNKKRRTAKSSALIAARVLRQVKELEDTVRRFEHAYHAEMNKVDSIISNLTQYLEGVEGVEAVTGDSEELSG